MTPEERILAYLTAHKSSIEFSTLDAVVKQIKLFVFYSMPPISDEEILKIVKQWAMIHAVGLLIRPQGGDPTTTPGGTSSASDSPLIDAVKKAITTINDGVTIGRKNANINIGVTGLTANLKKGENGASLALSWTGTLKLDAESGPFHFSGNLSKDKWEITLSYPQDTYIPDLPTLGKVFTEGERAIRGMAEATQSFSNIQDATKVAALMKPHATALQSAVEAVSGIAKADKKGGPSFGFKLGSPDPMPGQEGIPPGIQGQVVFTYRF